MRLEVAAPRVAPQVCRRVCQVANPVRSRRDRLVQLFHKSIGFLGSVDSGSEIFLPEPAEA